VPRWKAAWSDSCAGAAGGARLPHSPAPHDSAANRCRTVALAISPVASWNLCAARWSYRSTFDAVPPCRGALEETSMTRLLGLTLALTLGSMLFVDCTARPTAKTVGLPPADAGPPAPSSETAGAPSETTLDSEPGSSPSERADDPDAARLAQTRLVASDCAANHRAARERL